MKIVITGSDGFIGQHLRRRLRNHGHDIVGLDVKSGNDVLSCDLPAAEMVFHLAAQTDATSTDAEADARINILGLLRVLQTYRSKVVFASSSMVNYPVTPYAIAKNAGEQYVRLFGGSIVRLCNIYGPGGHSVIDRFAASETLTIYGDGRQVRTYANVDAAVDLFVAEIDERRPFRTLGGSDYSVLEIAARYPDRPRVFVPPRSFDPLDGRQIAA